MTLMLMPNKHFGEEVFENYAFDRLSGEETARFEEHLLQCEQCQSLLAETDDYIRLMKAATAAYIAGHPKASPTSRVRGRGLYWNAAAAAVLLLTCLSALLSWRTPAGDTRTVALEAFRGGKISAPADHPLELQLDLEDVRPAAAYRVEVVDAAGHRVWFGGTPARLAKGLAAGTYWVRLSTDTGELLREYGVTVR